MSIQSTNGANLSIRKTVDQPSPQPGEQVTWTVHVRNDGPETAENVIVYDSLPGGVSHQGDQANVGDYDENIGQWQLGSLASGATATLNIVTIVDVAGSAHSNTASVASATFDPDLDNNIDTAVADAQAADLRIEKSVSDANPQVGDEVTWTITVVNDGPDAASVVKVNDVLPDGVRHVSDISSFGDYDEFTGEWFIGELLNGDRATLTITTEVVDATNTQINSAVVSSPIYDPDLSDNTAAASITADGDAADLHVEKSVSDSHPAIGDQVTWTVELTNEGPNAATNVSLWDTLPSGVTLVSSSVTLGKFDNDTGQWCIDTLESGHVQTLTLVTTVNESSAQTNTATVDSDVFDPDPSDNTDTATIHGGSANLAIDKQVDNPNPDLGEEVNWTITLTNNGPDDAVGVNVRDALPSGLNLVAQDATVGFYDQGQGQWWIGELASGATQTLVISTLVTDATSAIENTSVVTSRTDDPDLDDNSSSAATDAESADLAIEKSVSDENPNVGDDISWSMTVTNNGPDTATNVVVYDTLPNGVRHVSDTASSGEYDEDAGNWVIGDLASGESQTLTIVTTVIDSDLQMNIAMVTSDTFDPNDCDNTDFASTDADSAADLSVVKTVDNAAPAPGENVTWTLVVTNSGPDTAINTLLADTLPTGLTYINHSADTGDFDVDSGQWIIGDLASGASVALSLVTSVDSVDALINTGSVSSDTFDSDPDNNTDDAVTDAVLADVMVTKTVDNESPNVGAEVNWTIVVTNNGPDTAANVLVADTLPAGVSHVNSSASVGNYDVAGGSWLVGDLASGGSATLEITTTVDDPATAQVNTSVVTSDTFDSDPDNNTDTAQTDAVLADLVIVKTVDDEMPNVGAEVNWQIVVTNNGPDASSNVVVADALPAGVAHTSSTATVGNYDVAAGSWAVGDLASGASATLSITTTVNDPSMAQVNTSTVSSDTFETNTDNNTDSAQTDAVLADLAIVKMVDDENPDAGAEVNWTIVVTNNGPDGSNNVIVEDVLPAGVSATDVDTSVGLYDALNGRWEVGNLANGASATLVIATTVDDPSVAQVNTSTVTSDTFDSDTTNNTDTAQTDAQLVDLVIEKTVDNATPDLGSNVTWTIEVTNNGPDAAANVVVSDVLPAGVTHVRNGTSDGAYNITTGDWAIGELASGASVLLAITTRVDDANLIVNTSAVTTDTFEADTNNNSDDASVDALAADLSLEKSVDNSAPSIGDNVTWTLVLSNDGPDAATGVIVSDALPAGVSFVSADTVTGSFDDATGLWNVGGLAVGAAATLTITTQVMEAGAQLNSAQVSSVDQFDPDSTPNNDIATEDDQSSAEISVAKAGPVAAGNSYEVLQSGQETINAFMVIDRSSSMNAQVKLADGTTASRLEVTRDAVVDFARNEQIVAVKIVAFDRDTVAQGVGSEPSEVSSWIDVTTAAGFDEMSNFVQALSLGAGTNYEAAINASQEYLSLDAAGATDPVPNAEITNYYFLSDGDPTRGGGPDHLLDEGAEAAWEAFVDANFNESYAIGFGGNISRYDALDQVAHEVDSGGDDPTIAPDDPNTLEVADADDIPAQLFELISETVAGNVLSDDTGTGIDSFGPDGAAAVAIVGLSMDSVSYSWDGSDVLVAAGSLPVGSSIEGSVLNIPTAMGGRLEFDFSSGDFEYSSADAVVVEQFDYTIADNGGNTDSAIVTLDVVTDDSGMLVDGPSNIALPSATLDIGDLLAINADELFSEDTDMDFVGPVVAAQLAVSPSLSAGQFDHYVLEGPMLPDYYDDVA